MDVLDDSGLGQRQQVDVSSEVGRMIGEVAAIGLLIEFQGLDHRSDRPVEDDDPVAEQAFNSFSGVSALCHHYLLLYIVRPNDRPGETVV